MDKKNPEIEKALEEGRIEGMTLALRYVQDLLKGKDIDGIFRPLDPTFQDIKARIRALQGK